jgi:glutamate dehydrogenase (NADP+)
MKYSTCHQFLHTVEQRNPGQPEFLQAVTEVMESLWPFIAQHPRYAEQGLLDRLVEPERVVMFRVSWVDDHG